MKTKTSNFSASFLSKVLLGTGLFLLGGLAFSQSYAKSSTPESCFYFSNGTITNYFYGGINSKCGKNVIVPDKINGVNVTSLSHPAFYEKGLDSIVLPKTLKIIGGDTLSKNNFTKLVIPEGVTTIGRSAARINKLQSLSLPSSVQSMGIHAFNFNELPDNQAFIYARKPDGTEDKTKIVSYGGQNKNPVIPNGLITIDEVAFRNSDLEGITIPNTVKHIGPQAFEYNNLQNLTIPDSVTSIGGYAFRHNRKVPVEGYRTAGIQGLTIGLDANIVINPFKLIVQHKNPQGQTLTEQNIFYGPNETSLDNRSPETANEYFQPGATFLVKPNKLKGYFSPEAQQITFPSNPNPINSTITITFIYEKINPELVLHYTFDDESNLGKDSSGKGNHGTPAGEIQGDEWGRVGGAAYFDGKNDFIRLPIAPNNEFTISTWMKRDDLEGRRGNIIGGSGFELLSLTSPHTPPVTSKVLLYNWGRDKAPYELGKRVHVAFVGNESKTVLYLNGQEVAEGYAVKEINDARGFTIGARPYQGKTGNPNQFFKGWMDDFRIYNYALTPQAIQSLYQSYPPEDSLVAGELELYAKKTSGLFVETNELLNITSKFFKAAKNTTLELWVPESLKVREYSIVPNDDGTSPISGKVLVTQQGTGMLYKMNITPGTIGQVSTPFLIYFPSKTTADGATESIKAVLKKESKIIAEKEITFEAYNKSRITLYSITPAPTLLGNNIDITYQLITQTNYQAPGSKNRGWGDPKGAMFYDTWATIPLPAKAVFIKGGNSNVKYDATSHSVKIKYGNYRGRQDRRYFTVRYKNVQPGEKVQGGDIVFTGKEGNTVPREFIYSGINNVISESKLKLGVTIYHSLTNQGAGTYIPGTKNADFYHLGIRNHGNDPVENMEVTWNLPDGLQGKTIRIPRNSLSDRQGRSGKVTVTAINNNGNAISKSFASSTSDKILDAKSLGFKNNEYIKVVKFKLERFNPGDYSVPNYGGQLNPIITFSVAGDVASNYENGTKIKGGDPVIMNWDISGNGKELYSGKAQTTFASKSYTPISLSTAISGNQLVYKQGDKTSITLNASWSSYPYANGTYLKDPTVYFIVPRGFVVPVESIKVTSPQHFQIKSIEQITPKIAPPQEAIVYRVRITGELGKGKSTLYLTANLNITKDALPKEYDFREFVSLGSEDPNSQVRYGYGARDRKDNYGLIGNPNEFYIVGPGISDAFAKQGYHKYRYLTVASSVFGLSNCFKTPLSEGNCKSTFEVDNPFTWSNFKSGEKGEYTVTLYNNSSKEVKDFNYTVYIPQEGSSTYGSTVNQWTPKLSKAPSVQGAQGATILYSSDGTNYSKSYGSDLSKIKSLKIKIPSVKKGEYPKITIGLQAPTFISDQAGRISYLKTSYTLGGEAGSYDGGVLGMRLVKDDFTEDPKYAFCSHPKVTNTNPKISEAECKALIDLYYSTNGTGRTASKGRRNATEPIYTKYLLNICTWHGISCKNGQITQLNLEKNNLKGKLEDSFSILKNLEILNLASNQLTTKLEPIQSPKLRELNLSNNPLQTKIPNNFFSKNSALEIINLSKAELKGEIPPLGEKIKQLILSENRLSKTLPVSLAQLKDLEVLKLDNNLLVGPIPHLKIGDKEVVFTKLKEFTLHNNYIKDVAEKYSQIYLSLLRNNKKISENVGNNSKQYKIILVDEKGNNKKEHLKPGETVNITMKKQLFTQGRFIDVPLGEKNQDYKYTDGIEVINQNFPSYTIKVAAGKADGIFQIKVAGAEGGADEWIHAKFLLSQGEIDDPNEGDPGQWETSEIDEDNELLNDGLHFQLGAQYLDQYFSVVHFNVAGNDFGGGFFWLPVEKLENPITIEAKTADGGTEKKLCYNKVRGFYYNSQRGERIRPLDLESQQALKQFSAGTYGNLQTKGGRYTSCKGASENQKNKEDPYGIYGAITHTYNRQSFQLNAGIAYDTRGNKMKADGLRCNFQRLNNSYPFGYIYDDDGHIGFVGAKIKNQKLNEAGNFHDGLNDKIDNGICINEIFDYNGREIGYTQDPNKQIDGFTDPNSIKDFIDLAIGSAKTTLFNLGIKGIVGLTSEINNEEKKFVQNNSLDSALLLKTDSNISQVVNVANKNAEYLCRGKRQSGNINVNPSVICINENTLSRPVSPSDIAGKTVIVRNANLTLEGYQTREEQPINLFIDKGNLILSQTETDTGSLAKFDSFGYLIKQNGGCPNDNCSRANYLKGNFIINGLLLAGENGEETLKNKLYIHGKLVSLNTFGQPTDQKVETVRKILGNEKFTNHIALDSLFVWGCDAVKGIGSDGTRCKGEKKQTSLLVDKAFGLIDMDFSSLLFR